MPVPYAQTKSARGRKKHLDSDGRACLDPACRYFLITDASLHALVGDGKRGIGHDIQHWHCQACGRSYTMRRGTLLYRLKTPTEVVEQALKLMCLGVACADIADVVGVDEGTMALWLERGGQHGQHLHNLMLREPDAEGTPVGRIVCRVARRPQARLGMVGH